MYYDMQSYAKQIVSFYCDLCGVSEESLKPVPSPALPESSTQDEEAEKQGELHRDAAKALMRLLWLSRLSRPDLSFIIGGLASNVSRWSKWDDCQLHRVVSYLKHTISLMCCGRVSYGHKPELYVYTDADFAACPWTARSTTDIFIGVKTGDSLFPIHWQSRKQSSIARCTPEAEMIAFASALYGATPCSGATHATFFETDINVKLEQDNDAVLKIISSKYSVKLRHCNRVHRVNIASICETLEKENTLELRHCKSEFQRGNSLTKVIPPCQWQDALNQLCVEPG